MKFPSKIASEYTTPAESHRAPLRTASRTFARSIAHLCAQHRAPLRTASRTFARSIARSGAEGSANILQSRVSDFILYFFIYFFIYFIFIFNDIFLNFLLCSTE
jgi:hypothetical protein